MFKKTITFPNKLHIKVLLLLSVLSLGFLTIIMIKTSLHEKRFEKTLRESMKQQAEWFVKNQKPEGDFEYELWTDTGSPSNDYNIVRQAGSVYALSQFYKDSHDPIVENSLVKAYAFFYDKSVITNEKTNARAISEKKNQIKSNTNALLVLSLIDFVKTDETKNKLYLEQTVEYANYLLETQTAEGGYIYSFEYNPPQESSYNDGETLYALVSMYKLTKDEKYLDSSVKAANFFITRYKDAPIDLSFFSWGMAGYAHLYDVTKDEKYWDFMKIYSDKFLEGHGKGAIDYFSGISIQVPHSNLSVFLEGLAHVAWIAKDKDPEYYTTIKEFYETSLGYILTLQINGPESSRATEFEKLKGGICYTYSCDRVRIDMVHHALSAMHLYFKYVN